MLPVAGVAPGWRVRGGERADWLGSESAPRCVGRGSPRADGSTAPQPGWGLGDAAPARVNGVARIATARRLAVKEAMPGTLLGYNRPGESSCESGRPVA
jgi:hypothetical protein